MSGMSPIAVLAFLSVFPFQQTPAKPVTLTRKYILGEKAAYRVRADIQIQSREGELRTFIPEDEGLEYDFTTEVKQLKPDGIADIIYRRPTIKIIQGETFDSGIKTTTEKINLNYLLTLSPINEVLADKDLNPPKKEKAGPDKLNLANKAAVTRKAQDFFDGFIEEVQRLSVFIGSLDSSLDFNPKFPFDEVVAGDTWKRTVGFQPQKLKGTDGKQAVQRLDITYTFKGSTKRGPKDVYRIEADLNHETDLSQFLNQLAEIDSEITGIKRFPLRLKAKVTYDIDPATGRTLGAVAESEGGYDVVLTSNENDPIVEEKLKGRTVMSLLSVTNPLSTKKAPAKKTPPPKGKTKGKSKG